MGVGCDSFCFLGAGVDLGGRPGPRFSPGVDSTIIASRRAGTHSHCLQGKERSQSRCVEDQLHVKMALGRLQLRSCLCGVRGGRTSSRCPPYTTTNDDVSQESGIHSGLNTTHLSTDRLSSHLATQPPQLRKCFPHQQPARSSFAVLSPHPPSVLALLSRPLREHAHRSHVARKPSQSLLRLSS